MMIRFALSAVLTTAALLAPGLSAQNGLRLTRVPDRVVLPPPAGSNLLVEVVVTGKPSAIWLARNRDQIGGVKLTSSGTGTYQINLAEPRVLRLLHAERAEGSFRVFARFGTEVMASAEIAWSRGSAPASHVKCFVIAVDGRKRQGTTEYVRWLDAREVERIEIHGTAAPQARAMARAGTTDLPLTWRQQDRQFVLEFHEGLRQSLHQAGALTIEVRVGNETTLFDYRVVPDRLQPVDEPGFLVMQRRTGEIPGSRGWLEVRIGDITMGRVRFLIKDAKGRTVVGPLLVGDRDHVEFALANANYVLVVDKLVNRLIGEDYAELSIRDAAKYEPDRIALLIRRVEATTDITFVREGVDYSSAIAAQLLRSRLASHRGDRPTPQEFAVMGGTSRTTGNAYLIRTADGKEVQAEAWLKQLLVEIERDRARAKQSPKQSPKPSPKPSPKSPKPRKKK